MTLTKLVQQLLVQLKFCRGKKIDHGINSLFCVAFSQETGKGFMEVVVDLW